MYRCRACGRIITEEQYIEEQEGGSGGYCLCEFSDGNRVLNEMVEAKWWELLDWNQMENTWERLSDEIKDKIREAALAPTYDVKSLTPEDEKLRARPQGDKITWKRYPSSPWGDIEICEHGCTREYGSTEKVCVHCDYPSDANIVLSRCTVCGSTTWHLDGECMRCASTANEMNERCQQ